VSDNVLAGYTVDAYKLYNHSRLVTNYDFNILPPGILSLLVKVFWAAGLAKDFQCFAASSVRCKLWEP
jgi:hypothetical protein